MFAVRTGEQDHVLAGSEGNFLIPRPNLQQLRWCEGLIWGLEHPNGLITHVSVSGN